MKRAKGVLPIILPAVVIVGALTVSGHADKPAKPPGLSKPLLIHVTGGIVGEGDPAHMPVTFLDGSFSDVSFPDGSVGSLAGTYVANPDGPLEVLGVRKGARTLRYYYCDACPPDGIDCCNDPSHDPASYYALMIYGGVLEGKRETEQIVFAIGSEWEIRSKEPYGETFATGTLKTPVIYKQHD